MKLKVIAIAAGAAAVGLAAFSLLPSEAASPATASGPVAQTGDAPLIATPTTAPQDWTWAPVQVAANQTTAVPTNAAYGGVQTDPADPLWRGGWTQNPLGALAAATALQPLVDVSVTQAQTHLLEGPYKTSALTFAARGTSMLRDGESPQLVAFRFNAFTPQTASIQLVYSAGPQFKVLVATTNLQWVNGDWRAEAGEERVTVSRFETEAIPTGFIKWEAPAP